MTLLLLSLASFLGFGLASLLSSDRTSPSLGMTGTVVGSLLGIAASLPSATGGPNSSARAAWDVPFGSLAVGIDPLSAFFLLPIFAVTALGAIYGYGYLAGKGRPGSSWFFYNLLAAGMVLVVTARNGVLFLIAWEVMSLASYFLVTTDDESASVRKAGWTYLVATHIGTAFLLVLFALLGGGGADLDFERFAAPPSQAGILFLLAVVGFGTKAGFIPLHVWLPEAHPAAPSHVSAVMSGVMIKTGIYGILRTLTFLGPPPPGGAGC